MGLDYEEQNALEWQDPEKYEENARKRAAAQAAATKPDAFPWNIVASKNTRAPRSNQGQPSRGPAPSQPTAARPDAFAWNVVAAKNNPKPRNSQGQSIVGRGPPHVGTAQAKAPTAPGPTYPNAVTVRQPMPQGGNTGPSRFVSAERVRKPDQAPQEVPVGRQPGSAPPHVQKANLVQPLAQNAKAPTRPPNAFARQAPGRMLQGARHANFGTQTSGRHHEHLFARVRPENDNFDKDTDKSKKDEQRARHLVERKAEGRDEFGHRGIFVLGDQIAARPEPIKQSLKELTERHALTVDTPRGRPLIELIAPEAQTIHLALSRCRGAIVGSLHSQEQFQMILVESPGDGLALNNAEVHIISAWHDQAKPAAAGLDLPSNKTKAYASIIPTSRNNVDFDMEDQRRRKNSIAVQVATTRALGRLVHYKGSITMRIHFGALALYRYAWKQGQQTQTAETFISNLRKSGTEAGFYKMKIHTQSDRSKKDSNVLQPDEEPRFFQRVTNAQHLLVPYYGSGSIKETRPAFTGYFIWKRADKTDMIYEVATNPVGNNVAERPSVVGSGWMPPNAPGLTKPLSIFMTQLNGGISAALQIYTEEKFIQPTEIPAGLTAQVIRPIPCKDYATAARNGELLFDWVKTGCYDFRQRTTWKFRVAANADYVFELTRYDSYSKLQKAEETNKHPTESRWDACVYHDEWNEKFAENISLRRGEKAGWDPSTDNFFPGQPGNQGELGVPPGLATIMRWIREFLDSLNVQERQNVWLKPGDKQFEAKKQEVTKQEIKKQEIKKQETKKQDIPKPSKEKAGGRKKRG